MSSFLPEKKTLLLCSALYLACALLVYGGSLQNRFVSLDDNYLIYENPIITRITPQTIKHIFTTYDPELYDPLTFLTYQIDYQIGGIEPTVYHAQSLFWHTLNALLVAALLWMLFRNGIIAVALGLLFLVHPLNTEAVAWAAARKDVLATFFFLSSLLAYMHYRAEEKKSVYWLSIGLFVLGLLSKVVVITLPVVLLLIDWREGRGLSIRMLKEKWPYFLTAVIFGIVALFGKTNALVVTSLGQKMLMAFKSTWFTFTSFFVPFNLSALYPYSGPITLSSADFFLPVLAVLLLCALALMSVRRTRKIAFALAFFVLTLAPTFINFAKGNEIFIASDRYAYIPMIGLLCLLAASIHALLDRRLVNRSVILAVLIGLLAGASLLTVSQAATWRDSETLYRHALTVSPHSLAARNNLGMVYLYQQKYDEALNEFNTLLEQRLWPTTLVNRGLTYARQGKSALAVADYRKALELDPKTVEASYELGNISYREGRLEEAVELYRKALETNPRYTNALNNLGATYLQLEQWEKAAQIFEQLIAFNPLFTEAYYNLAVIYEQTGKMEEAAMMYERSLELHPNDPDALAGLARTRASHK